MTGPVEAYLIDGVHVRLRPHPRLGYFGVAKRERFQLPGINALTEPGDLWFEYDSNKADLVDKLVLEVKADQ